MGLRVGHFVFYPWTWMLLSRDDGRRVGEWFHPEYLIQCCYSCFRHCRRNGREGRRWRRHHCSLRVRWLPPACPQLALDIFGLRKRESIERAESLNSMTLEQGTYNNERFVRRGQFSCSLWGENKNNLTLWPGFFSQRSYSCCYCCYIG